MDALDNAGQRLELALMREDLDRIIADLRASFPRVFVIDPIVHRRDKEALIDRGLALVDDPREATESGKVSIILPPPEWEPRRVLRYVYADRYPYLGFATRPGLSIHISYSRDPDPQPTEAIGVPLPGYLSLSVGSFNLSYDKFDPRDRETLKVVKRIIFKGRKPLVELTMPDCRPVTNPALLACPIKFQATPGAAGWALSAPNYVIGAVRHSTKYGGGVTACLPVGWEAAPAKRQFVEAKGKPLSAT